MVVVKPTSTDYPSFADPLEDTQGNDSDNWPETTIDEWQKGVLEPTLSEPYQSVATTAPPSKGAIALKASSKAAPPIDLSRNFSTHPAATIPQGALPGCCLCGTCQMMARRLAQSSRFSPNETSEGNGFGTELRERSPRFESDLRALTIVSDIESNDTPETAQFINLGFDTGEDSAFLIAGTLSAKSGDSDPVRIFPNEPDETILTANKATPIAGGSVIASGFIGDGAFPGSDVDFYEIGATAGEAIAIDIDASAIGSDLDSFLILFDDAGNVLGFNDDFDGSDSFIEFIAPSTGNYYVGVSSFSNTSYNPFIAGSGENAVSSGAYDIFISRDLLSNTIDPDFFSFDLNAGDIFSASVFGGNAETLSFRDPNGVELVGSSNDASFIYPSVSPLAGGGDASLSYVINTSGTYSIGIVDGVPGSYTLDLDLFRPELEQRSAFSRQKVFLDFDGAFFNPFQVFGSGINDFVNVSPLSAFLNNWGLSLDDEDAVIDAIVATVKESLEADIRALGKNGDFQNEYENGAFDIEILNSRDHGEQFGNPDVTRVIIGGTIAEIGIPTIGIAQSIDVGNFDTEETAIVLLDFLSAPASDPNSLNQYALAPEASIIDLIGIGVGNIAAHEAGHTFGNFHTETFNANPNIMDRGGNLDNVVGVGADRVFGSADDADVDFGTDTYEPSEGFTGREDTLNTIAFGLSTPISLAPLAGTNGDDTLEGTPGNDLAFGLAGSDFVMGGEGRDTLNGQQGNDTILGGSEDDRLEGNLGQDSLDGGLGQDSLFGGELDDTLLGNNGGDELHGGVGNDSLHGQNNNDTLFGDDGDDILLGSFGQDSLDGGLGQDSLFGGNREDTLLGSNGGDLLDGGRGNDSLDGQNNNDTLFGDDGDDILQGGLGQDSLDGGLGQDSLFGGDREDTLLGSNGGDLLDGGRGNDSLDGQNNNDTLFGGEGDDFLQGNFGADALDGGSGEDALFGGQQNDILVGGLGNDTLNGGSGDDTLRGVGSNFGQGTIDLLQGETGRDRYILGEIGHVFYDDDITTTDGLGDYAQIQTFSTVDDVIQLAGIASDYVLGASDVVGITGTAIFLDRDTDELIAVVEGVSGLDLTDRYFEFA